MAMLGARPLVRHPLRQRVPATIFGLIIAASLIATAGVAAQSLDWVRNPATGHWYAVVHDMAWSEGEAFAVSLGGHLATINDEAEDRWIGATLQEETFAGLNDIAKEGKWVWASGEPVTYTNWLPDGAPNNGTETDRDTRDVLHLNFDDSGAFGWMTARIDDQMDGRNFPLLIEVVSLVAPPAEIAAVQSLDWQRNPQTGHWYTVVHDMTWAEGEALAIRLGGHLATINDEAEDRWIADTFAEGMLAGLNDLEREGQWVWASGEPLAYTNWLPGEPDDGGGLTTEDVVHLELGSFGWTDEPPTFRNEEGTVALLIEVVSLVAPPGEIPVGTPTARPTATPTARPTATPTATPTAPHTATPTGPPPSPPGPSNPPASTNPQASPIVAPIILVGLPPIAAVTTSGDHACLLGTDGSVWCWGRNSRGQLGVDAGAVDSSDAPLKVAGLPGPALEVVAFGESTCALTVAGEAWCWGANWEGVLGDGTATDRATPAAVVGLPSGIAHLATSGSISNMCALDAQGVAYCWGDNSVGALGDGTTDAHAGAVRVTVVDQPLSEVSAAGDTTCAVTNGGAVRCWGLLWNGDPSGRIEPATAGPSAVTPKGLGSGVAGLSADGDIACAAMRDGAVRCWSWGVFEQTPGTAWLPPDVPTAVAGLPSGIDAVTTSSWIRTEAGAPDVVIEWACGIGDGQAWCWGDNAFGQLGDGTLVDRPTPVHVQAVGLWQLVAGTSASLALGLDGAPLLWGDSDPTPRSPFASVPVTGGGYRQPDTLVPGITTHIPTPGEISIDLSVLGANLLLAALVMLAFVIATELLNRSLGELEPILSRRFRVVGLLRRSLARLDAAIFQRRALRHRRLVDVARLTAIAAFYGIAFALLDPTWDPLTITGVWLVLVMAVAAGVVGLGGDIAAWAVGRRWGVVGNLEIKAGSMLAAVGSALLSRTVALVPGVMIGSPEAMDIDPERIDQRRLARIAAVGLGTVLLIGVAAWGLTLGTSALRGNDRGLDVALGGAEAFLLLVFAFAVQNGFVQLLAFRQSAGLALRRTHRVLWGVALLFVTFAFWHTLVNPGGDLAAAVRTTNVLAFLVIASLVLVFSVAIWIGTRVARWVATEAAPVRLIGDDELVDSSPTRAVDLQHTFRYGPKAIAETLGVDTGLAKALRWQLGIEGDLACRHDFVFGRMKVPMYSDRALELMREAIAAGANLSEVRRAYQAAGRP